MKKLFKLVFVILTLFGIGLFLVFQNLIAPVAPGSQEKQIFVIPQGWTAAQISQELKKSGLIKNDLLFQLLIWQKQAGHRLKAGDFRLSPSMKMTEIIDILLSGPLDIWITIPEGWRKEEIGLKIYQSFKEAGVEFDFNDFLTQSQNLEGYLFPDTYLIPQNASPSSVIRVLQGTFEQKFKQTENKTNLSKKQLVVLASLLEREARNEADRRLVAGILLKRLKKGWPLQVDAAAQYIKGTVNCGQNSPAGRDRPLDEELNCDWWPLIKPEDLEIDSLYNTYDNLGLPPTPICNPGLVSLEAAANPQETEYWFYLSDKEGKIHYTGTLEEHEENINKFLISRPEDDHPLVDN